MNKTLHRRALRALRRIRGLKNALTNPGGISALAAKVVTGGEEAVAELERRTEAEAAHEALVSLGDRRLVPIVACESCGDLLTAADGTRLKSAIFGPGGPLCEDCYGP